MERVSIQPASTAALSSGRAAEHALDHGSAGDMACFFSDKPRAPALNASASMAMLQLTVAKRQDLNLQRTCSCFLSSPLQHVK